MKLSKNFLNEYVDVEADVVTLAEDMTRVGNEYDSAESLVPATKLIIGKVLECTDHPDSDHLHCCKVDIGNEVLNIVCGAPNVRAGIKVIVAQNGAGLPGDVTIKKGMIRGQESNGMLCSLQELGLETKYVPEKYAHGIYVLGDDAKPGEDALKYLNLVVNICPFSHSTSMLLFTVWKLDFN